MEIINIIVNKKIEIGVFWYGPFIAVVECFRPDTIKAFLKGLQIFSVAIHVCTLLCFRG